MGHCVFQAIGFPIRNRTLRAIGQGKKCLQWHDLSALEAALKTCSRLAWPLHLQEEALVCTPQAGRASVRVAKRLVHLELMRPRHKMDLFSLLILPSSLVKMSFNCRNGSFTVADTLENWWDESWRRSFLFELLEYSSSLNDVGLILVRQRTLTVYVYVWECKHVLYGVRRWQSSFVCWSSAEPPKWRILSFHHTGAVDGLVFSIYIHTELWSSPMSSYIYICIVM